MLINCLLSPNDPRMAIWHPLPTLESKTIETPVHRVNRGAVLRVLLHLTKHRRDLEVVKCLMHSYCCLMGCRPLPLSKAPPTASSGAPPSPFPAAQPPTRRRGLPRTRRCPSQQRASRGSCCPRSLPRLLERQRRASPRHPGDDEVVGPRRRPWLAPRGARWRNP